MGVFEVTVTQSGGANYTVIAEAQTVHQWNPSPSTPSNAVSEFALAYSAHAVRGLENLLAFSFKLATSAADWLVFEIEAVNQRQQGLFASATLNGLVSGQRVPCAADGANLTVASGSQLVCTIQTGSVAQFGQRMRVFVTNFANAVASTLTIYFYAQNPTQAPGASLNVALKAFGNATAGSRFAGQLMYGYASLESALSTFAIDNSYANLVDRAVVRPQARTGFAGSFLVQSAYGQLTASSYSLVRVPLFSDAFGAVCDVSANANLKLYVGEGRDTAVYLLVQHASAVAELANFSIAGVSCQQYVTPWEVISFRVRVGADAWTRVHHYTGQLIDAAQVAALAAVSTLAAIPAANVLLSSYAGGNASQMLLTLDNLGALNTIGATAAASATMSLNSNMLLALNLSNSIFEGDAVTGCSVVAGISNANAFQPVLCSVETVPNARFQRLLITNFTAIAASVQLLLSGTNVVASVTGASAVWLTLWLNALCKSDYNRTLTNVYDGSPLVQGSFAISFPAIDNGYSLPPYATTAFGYTTNGNQNEVQNLLSVNDQNKLLEMSIPNLISDPEVPPVKVPDQSLGAPNVWNETWKQSGFRILTIVKKFISAVKEIAQQYRFKEMDEHRFQIINDRASNADYFRYTCDMRLMPVSRIQKVIWDLRHWTLLRGANRPSQRRIEPNQLQLGLTRAYTLAIQIFNVLSPESQQAIVWNAFLLLTLMLNLFGVPLQITFQGQDTLPAWLHAFVGRPMAIFMIVEILINFNMAYYLKGMIVTNRRLIALNYLQEKFLWHLVVTVMFTVSAWGLSDQLVILQIVILLRFRDMFVLANKIVEHFNLRENQNAIYELGSLIVLIIYIAHFCGCSFIYLGHSELNSAAQEQSWLARLSIVDASWSSQYITGLYWGVITMITVGNFINNSK